jgi:hypothetical protein
MYLMRMMKQRNNYCAENYSHNKNQQHKMTQIIDPSKPVVQGRASIITSDIKVRVYWKAQLKNAIEWLIEKGYDFEWEILGGATAEPDTYLLTVNNICWASNLVVFAGILESCDYEYQNDEPDDVVVTDTFIGQILETSKNIVDGRSRYAVLAKATEELGELAQEVMIAASDHYKEPGKDGIIGEAIDVMVCCTDIIFSVDDTITEPQMQELLAKKLVKWKEKSELRNTRNTK